MEFAHRGPTVAIDLWGQPRYRPWPGGGAVGMRLAGALEGPLLEPGQRQTGLLAAPGGLQGGAGAIPGVSSS